MNSQRRSFILYLALFLLVACFFFKKSTSETFFQKIPFLPLEGSSDYNKYEDKKDPKSIHLGYSIYGYPYKKHYREGEKHGSQKKYDLREPEEPYRYFNWYDYQPTNYFLNHGKYIGYPWYYY